MPSIWASSSRVRCDCMYPSAQRGGIAAGPVMAAKSRIASAGSCASDTKTSKKPGAIALAGVGPGLRGVGAARRRVGNEQAAIVAPQVDLHPGRGDEEAPPSGTEQHGRGVARPVHVGLPSGLHRVELAAPVELDGLAPPC